MAWPLTPITTFLGNVTVITASFLNTLQAGVNAIVRGTTTLKSLQVDGTGGENPTALPGQLAVSGKTIAANSITVCQVFSGAGTYHVGDTVSYLGEVYHCIKNTTGAHELPTNAAYFTAIAGAPEVRALTICADAPISSATPGAGQSVPLGTVYKDTAIVAWGIIAANGTLIRGANLAAYSNTTTYRASAGVYVIKLNAGCAPSSLCVVATLGIISNATAGWTIIGGDDPSFVDQVDFEIYNASNAAADSLFSFLVLGGG